MARADGVNVALLIGQTRVLRLEGQGCVQLVLGPYEAQADAGIVGIGLILGILALVVVAIVQVVAGQFITHFPSQ